MPGGVLAEQLGGGRRHDHEIGALAEAGVRDRVGPVEQRRARRLRRQRRERERAHEAEGVLGEDGRDVRAGVDQATTDLDGLVGGDAAAHAEDDAAIR